MITSYRYDQKVTNKLQVLMINNMQQT